MPEFRWKEEDDSIYHSQSLEMSIRVDFTGFNEALRDLVIIGESEGEAQDPACTAAMRAASTSTALNPAPRPKQTPLLMISMDVKLVRE
jgi:hypothetical protein